MLLNLLMSGGSAARAAAASPPSFRELRLLLTSVLAFSLTLRRHLASRSRTHQLKTILTKQFQDAALGGIIWPEFRPFERIAHFCEIPNFLIALFLAICGLRIIAGEWEQFISEVVRLF